jgi:hypothetical protein
MSLLKTNEIQNYNGSSLTLTASTVSTSAQLNTGGNISVTGSLNVSDDSTTRTNLGLGTIATQDSDSITVTGGTATLGALTVSGSDSGDLVRITQTGSGNALVVEDSANPDSTPFVVGSSGNCGIGTSSPSQPLHVSGSAPIIRLTDTDTGSYSEISASSGDGNLMFFADQGNTQYSSNIRFYVDGNHAGRFDSEGNLLVGRTNNPSGVSNCIYGAGNYGVTTGSGANVFINSEGLFFRSTSSRRYKNSIQDTTHGLAELLTLRPVTFKTNEDGDKIYGGLIAEEVHEAGLTEFVQYNDENQPDALDYGNMVSLCIKAVQEQQTLIESQQSQIDVLTARIEALETT